VTHLAAIAELVALANVMATGDDASKALAVIALRRARRLVAYPEILRQYTAEDAIDFARAFDETMPADELARILRPPTVVIP